MTLKKSNIDKLEYSKAKNTQDIHWDGILPGFGVRVYPSGKRSFVLSYRCRGRSHIKVIGKYGVLTLEQARDLAQRHLVSLIDSKDPFDEKDKMRGSVTFKEFCYEYMERYAKQHKKTWSQDESRIRQTFLRAFGSVRIDAITRAEIAQLHGTIGQTYPYAANRCIEQLSKMFELAKIWGYVPETHHNPARGIQAYKETKRDRWVKPEELPRLAQAINREENFYGSKALWLYLLLGVRKSELLKAKWDDIDWGRQELRLPETKSGRVHYVPISEPALAILQNLPRLESNPYILPGGKAGHHLVNIQKCWARVRKAAGVEDVRVHDLRRTLGSWLAQAGNSLHLIGRVLNHSSQSTTAVYARFAQDNVKQALEAHGQKLMDVAGVQAPVKANADEACIQAN